MSETNNESTIRITIRITSNF